MTRTVLTIFLSVLALLMLVSHDTYASRRHNYPTTPPSEIEHALGVLNARGMKQPGEKLSITFWSSDDAASRLENLQWAAKARRDPMMRHIGVNIGDTPELFEAYLQRDRIESDTLQLLATGDVAKSLADTYGYRTLHY